MTVKEKLAQFDNVDSLLNYLASLGIDVHLFRSISITLDDLRSRIDNSIKDSNIVAKDIIRENRDNVFEDLGIEE